VQVRTRQIHDGLGVVLQGTGTKAFSRSILSAYNMYHWGTKVAVA